MIRARRLVSFGGVVAIGLTLLTGPLGYAAAGPNDGFSLQVTPSPMVETVKPGVTTSYPLQIRNGGTATEDLKVEVRHFTFDSKSGQVSIDDIAAPDLAQYVTFSAPKFSVAPGQVYSDDVRIAFPADAGFSYSFVLVISRQSQPQATGGGRVLAGTIADFALINIDRPGATQALSIDSFKMSAGVYEYVPATLSLTFKNTGNTFVRPAGTIYIGRGDVSHAIDTLPVNDSQGYILPGTSRTVTATWNDGFPRYDTETLSDGTVKKHEVWNFADIGKFRVGEYTAKVTAVYSNGQYDVPLNASVTFWIIPWKILLGALIVLLIIGFGIFAFVRSVVGRVSSGRRRGGFRR